MSDQEITDELEALLRGTVSTLLETESALEAERAARREPIAIVSMACRLPGGADTPEAYWSLLERGLDALEEPTRWPDELLYGPAFGGANRARLVGGFLRDIERFDPAFFGISPREAKAMDPQQRIVLETAWEALERAGIPPASLAGSATGVYLGSTGSDYGLDVQGLEALDAYLALGRSSSVLAGRVAYVLGLQGPTLTVDTACSSSLVALHLACAGLRNRECDVALAGGSMVMNTPIMFAASGEFSALSPSGRCASFSADADGATWSEGCGLLVLKRLSDAQQSGDRILALVRSTAVNQDGRSQGLTAPNGPAQQRLLREALASAQLSSDDIDAIEAHGTGTPLGDPIEAGALAAVFGPGRDPLRPTYLGSSKSNLGHLQAAAGVAGVIKMVLALQHGLLPKTLHVSEPTPQIDWATSGLSVLQEAQPWPRGERVRRAGVSSFGVSGTNAHAILEEAPAAEPATHVQARPPLPVARLPLLLSGADDAALRAQAERWASWLRDQPASSWTAVRATAALRRTHLGERAAIFAESIPEALDALRALSQGAAHPLLVRGSARRRGKLTFVFPGQGSQWPAMGRALLTQSPAFADAVRACDEAMQPLTGWSVLALLRGDADASLPPLQRLDVVQPALFALAVGLAATLRELGVEPTAVVGHSQGELAAAVVSGALPLREGARIVATRGRILQHHERKLVGAMMVIEQPVAEVEAMLAEYGGALSVSAVNTAQSTNVSGEAAAADRLLASLQERGVFCRRIKVEHAGHCALLDFLLPELESALAPVRPVASTIPLYSTVLGERADTARFDAAHWCRNLREPVRLDRALAALQRDGHGVYVEVSPHPVLAIPLTSACAEGDGVVVGTLRREHGGLEQLVRTLGELHVQGLELDLHKLFGDARELADLPTYAFQRAPYRLAASAPAAASDSQDSELWSAVDSGEPKRVRELLGLPAELEPGLAEIVPALQRWHHARTDERELLGWLYDESWQRAPLSRAPVGEPGTWALFTPPCAEREAEQLRLALEQAGARVLHVGSSDDRAQIAQVLNELGEPLAGIVTLAPLDESASVDAPSLSGGLLQVLAQLQALSEADLPTRLWVLTRGAVRARSGDALRPQQSALWGLGRVAALEHPACWGGLLDLPMELDDASARELVRALLAGDDEDQVAIRSEGRLVRRLERVTPHVRTTFRARGTVLITGASGGLAAHLARFLVLRGAEHIVLASRRGEDAPGAGALRASLEDAGARVTFVRCDVAVRAEVASLLEQLREDRASLTAVMHLAGVSEPMALCELTSTQLERELSAKVGGAMHLHELLSDHALDAFVLYGSGAALWGGGFQGAYGAANAALEGLARQRHAAGLPACVVHWGGWADGGMVTREVEAQLARRGLRAMAPDKALRGLELALVSGRPSLGVFDIDWSLFAPVFAAARPSPLLRGIAEAHAALETTLGETRTSASSLRAALALAEAERGEAVRRIVQGEVAAVLGESDPRAVDPARDLQKLGFDSVMAVALRNRLSAQLGAPLPATLVFAARTVDAIARVLQQQAWAEPAAGQVVARAEEPVAEQKHTLIVNGIALAYSVRGEGEPLLLLHGWMGNRDDFLPFGDALGRGFRCIIPDLRGHGRSTNPSLTPITHRQCALDVYALLDHLGIARCKAIGVSFGANILLHMATQQPERIAAMVHVSGGTHFSEEVRSALSHWQAPSEEDWTAMRRRHSHGDRQIEALFGSVMTDESLADLHFTADTLRTVSASTLVVGGDRDRVYPVEMAVDLYRSIPDAQLWIVPDGPHNPAYDREEAFTELAMQFVRHNPKPREDGARPKDGGEYIDIRRRVDSMVERHGHRS